jgi:hypothetical protein
MLKSKNMAMSQIFEGIKYIQTQKPANYKNSVL